ncbi:MAG: hypothetical protein L0228_00065 [Planctomycetes bacterium]|nr:hypothetical protein [Planctomycetota bacterium]
MNVAELRGYVRTRATRIARAHVRRSIAELCLRREREADLTAAVLERAVHLVIRNLTVQPVVSIPSPHVRMRIAA